MSTPSRKRLMRDFKRLQQDPPAGISGAPQDNNIMLWNAVIFGPDDTPWDGGTFKLTLQFTEDYPNKPPTVRFVSKMFHPNSLKLDLRGPAGSAFPLPLEFLEEPSRNFLRKGFIPAVRCSMVVQCAFPMYRRELSILRLVAALFDGFVERLAVFYADGSICLDILQNQWSPIYDVAAILTSIQGMA
ncbi:hypothetical protein AXG93_1765s1030 [Marchantia polymorpha subsp. ruderalis]|uniref:UBC core domain-containing protein n=1 Tax=Marchantia polymorpha subsp. ruderalis TaxID=1480154 RepID=A0A176VGK3_MARPO|nr:hypothetical protein AXG93_1765s1030 [Marchantia polymorpha subsp. ruderalis]